MSGVATPIGPPQRPQDLSISSERSVKGPRQGPGPRDLASRARITGFWVLPILVAHQVRGLRRRAKALARYI